MEVTKNDTRNTEEQVFSEYVKASGTFLGNCGKTPAYESERINDSGVNGKKRRGTGYDRI